MQIRVIFVRCSFKIDSFLRPLKHMKQPINIKPFRFIQLFVAVISFVLLSCGGESDDPIREPEIAYGEFIDENTYNVNPTESDNFQIAQFRLWVPPSVEELKAVVVLTHSYNSNGLGFANSPYWQEFARIEKVAILAVYLSNFQGFINSYTDAGGGSGKAMLKSLELLSNRIGKDYIKDLPLLMRGYSAGGVFSYSFSGFLPERMLAFANIRGGGMSETSENNIQVPGLMFYAENDSQQRNFIIVDIIANKRLQNAQWALIKEPAYDHFGPLEKAEDMIQLFFSKVLAKRLDPVTNHVINLDERQGWLGSNAKLEAYDFTTYPYNKASSSWLIDEEFAQKWIEFQQE